jgi:hypothetical protein
MFFSIDAQQRDALPHRAAAIFLAAAAMATTALAGSGVAAEKTALATGYALRQKLAEPTNLLWSEMPLRQAVNELSQTFRVAILLDRRVDPGLKLNLTRRGDSLGATLQAIANDQGLGFTVFGNVVYLGPKDAVERLQGLANLADRQVRHLPPAMKLKFHKLQKLAWNDLASPRDLLAAMAKENGLTIANPDAIPHDLWAAAELPPLSLPDRLTLIASQFDLAVQLANDGRRIELTALPDNIPTIRDDRRNYSTAASPTKRPRATTAAAPQKPLETVGIGRIVIERKPLDAVLNELARRFELELKIDREAIDAAGIDFHQNISVHQENTTVDRLLGTMLEQAKLAFRRHGRTIEIFPAGQ